MWLPTFHLTARTGTLSNETAVSLYNNFGYMGLINNFQESSGIKQPAIALTLLFYFYI